MDCGAVNFGGRTPDVPCLGGWLGSECTWDDYSSVRRTLLLEHNGLVRALNAFNAIVGTKTAAKRWANPGTGYQGQTTPPGIITWDTPTTAAWAVYEESTALLAKYPDGFLSSLLDFDLYTLQGPVVAMMKLAMDAHAAACDVDEALLAAGKAVPQKPEDPPPEKTVAQEWLDFARTAGKGVAVFAGLGLLSILGYNYVTTKGKNKW